MVRINLINPQNLTDQHLIAEYNEILMLLGYVKDYPECKNIPKEYGLGKGHLKFFKDKLFYLQKRHEQIKKEMKKRGFKTRKRADLAGFERKLINNWCPQKKDLVIIKQRLKERIGQKPEFYRYYGKYYKERFFREMIEKA